MATVNEVLQDSAIAHQIDIQHYSNGVVRRMIQLLNRVDPDLFLQLQNKLEQLPASQFSVDRLELLLVSVHELNTQAYAAVTKELDKELLALTEYEAGYQQDLFKSVMPPQVQISAINAERVYAAAMARPFQGKLLSEWMQGLEADKATRIRDAIRIGYIENETISQMVKRIRGTRALKYADGLLEINRRNAEAIIRTAIGHTVAFTRDRFFEDNAEVIACVVWHSTLDGKTTHDCRIRDGKKYTPVTHKPIGHSLPWGGGAGNFHFGCRSIGVPATNSWQELGLNVDDLPVSTRASLDGQVPADLNYADWLKKQSAEFQNGVLGVTKGKLFRDGGLTLDRFSNNKGIEYTLAEMRERDASAFKKAGL